MIEENGCWYILCRNNFMMTCMWNVSTNSIQIWCDDWYHWTVYILNTSLRPWHRFMITVVQKRKNICIYDHKVYNQFGWKLIHSWGLFIWWILYSFDLVCSIQYSRKRDLFFGDRVKKKFCIGFCLDIYRLLSFILALMDWTLHFCTGLNDLDLQGHSCVNKNFWYHFLAFGWSRWSVVVYHNLSIEAFANSFSHY